MKKTRYKILLVEDDELDQKAFKRLVEQQRLPYDCTIVGSVSEARRVLGSQQFDIVLSDYSLGDGSAFDILGLVKDTPVILVTGAGDEEIAVKAWRTGAYDYLTKDMDRNYLKAVPITVENAIKHRKAEEKLRLLSGAIMSTDDSVYITDMEDKIIFVNKAFCDTYGYKEQEIVGKPSNILWIGKPQSDKTRSVFQTRTIGSTWEVGFYHRRKNGGIFPISLSRSLVKDSSGNDIAVVGIARDISERIYIEDELRTNNLRLEKQNHLNSELAVMVTEALYTLMSDKDIHRSKRLLRNYLDISKIGAGKMRLEPTKFSLCSVVSEVLAALSPVAAEKDIELKRFMPDSDLVIGADRNRIMQVLSTLVNQAIKSLSPGGHIGVLVREVDNEIRVQVLNDGPVMQSYEMRKIFDRFAVIKEYLYEQQEDRASTAFGDSSSVPVVDRAEELMSALGLPVAKELVELHGGCLQAESNQEQGNSFCFTLPKWAEPRKMVPAATALAKGKK